MWRPVGSTDLPCDVGQNIFSTPTRTLREPWHGGIGHMARVDIDFPSSWRAGLWATQKHRLTGVA